MTKQKNNSSSAIADAAVTGIQEVKGRDISVLDLRNLPNSICDYFVICHGTSDTHVDAIANSVEKTIAEKLGEYAVHTEGAKNAEWILMDYFDVIVHIFKEEARSFYNLEKLWADADILEIEHQH